MCVHWELTRETGAGLILLLEEKNKMSIYTIPIPCCSLTSKGRILGWLSQLLGFDKVERQKLGAGHIFPLERGGERGEGKVMKQERGD